VIQPRQSLFKILLFSFGLLTCATTAFSGGLLPITSKLAPKLFVWTDTCNVYVIRNGDSALLIDLGDGSVLDHLGEIGVKRVEWVLFTHHHREQCQGAGRLKGSETRIAVPELERELFENPTAFRKMDVRLEDKFTIHGASYVRPSIEPIRVDRALKTNEVFAWRGLGFLCLDTRGNSPGSLTYVLRDKEETFAFSGDVMLDGAKMHTWFETEWDYGFAAGIKALRESVERLQAISPTLLLPSHGKIVRNPQNQLSQYAQKLARLEPLYIRGYDVEHGSVAYQDKVSTPTVVSNVWQVSPHLFKFKRMNFWPNFSLILADNGHALLSDCGLLDERFLDTALDGMREHFGLKAIDAVIVSHMHGDHFLEAEHLRQKWGTQIWALENMVDKMEHPEWFDYSAPIQAYGKKKPDGSPLKGVHVDRAFKSGESFDWEGYRFTIDWMPGQTEFALCLHGIIDGRKIAFTGDNIFGDPDNPNQTGHEAMVAHNSALLEEGYIYGSEYLKRLNPDLLMGGHSFVMDHPGPFIERYCRWSYQMRDAFRDLSSEKDYRYWFDPFWVRAQPYRATVRRGESVDIELHVRNFNSRRQSHEIEVHTVAGLVPEVARLTGKVPANSRAVFPLRLRAATDAQPGVHIVGFDVTLDGRRYGERFDCVVNIE
jgi:glyoxylase-like metal-dependent hydrolase (beta-lactamase superfamily II)